MFEFLKSKKQELAFDMDFSVKSAPVFLLEVIH